MGVLPGVAGLRIEGNTGIKCCKKSEVEIEWGYKMGHESKQTLTVHWELGQIPKECSENHRKMGVQAQS